MGTSRKPNKKNGRFGKSVSINSKGTRIAVGAINQSTMGRTNNGTVEVFMYNDLDWVQVDDTIHGSDTPFQAGSSVSINNTGTVVSFVSRYAPGGGIERGIVQVYQNNSGKWTQKGNTINGIENSTGVALKVDIDSTGDCLLIGTKTASGRGTSRGVSRVYNFDKITNTWVQLSGDINGEIDNEMSSANISMSKNNKILAISAEGNQGGGIQRGAARVYRFGNRIDEALSNI